MTKYRYYSTQRPVAPGTFPNCSGLIEINNFDSKTYIPEIKRKAWGYIDYNSPLLSDICEDYELTFGGEIFELDDKQHICNLLLRALQATRGAHDLADLKYDPKREIVIGTFSGGGAKSVNVACDSGVSMIRDVVNHLGI